MQSCVTSKNVKWCHLIWPTLYMDYQMVTCPMTSRDLEAAVKQYGRLSYRQLGFL